MRYYFGKEKNEWPIVTKSSIPEIGIRQAKNWLTLTLRRLQNDVILVYLVPGDNSIAEPLRETLVDALQASKTRHYLENVATAIARPGVLSLMDEILEIKAGNSSCVMSQDSIVGNRNVIIPLVNPSDVLLVLFESATR